MKKIIAWFHGLAVTILIAMFLVDLPLEVLFQLLWINVFRELDFWIVNMWKMLLVASFIISPLVDYHYYKKEFTN